MSEAEKVKKVARFGLVGCGGIGNTHADALALLEEAELVAVSDVDISRARETAAKHGLTHAFRVRGGDARSREGGRDHRRDRPQASFRARNGGSAARRPRDYRKADYDVAREAFTLLETAKTSGVKLGGVFQRRFFRPRCECIKRSKTAKSGG